MKKSGKQYHDPLIDEVGERRAHLSARYGNDLKKLCDAICAVQEKHPEKMARPQPKK